MAASAPMAIGTRGTIGSLVRKEIEYFKTFNTCPQFDPRRGSSEEQRDSSSRLSSWFSRTNWIKKKKRQSRVGGGGGRFLPSMCSVVDVSGETRVPGFNYMILNNDEKGLRV